MYKNICVSLFEKDKLLFSFILSMKLLAHAGALNTELYRFFLTGGIDLGDEKPEKPATWLSDKSWGEILRLTKIKGMKDFKDDFVEKIEDWAKVYDSAKP